MQLKNRAQLRLFSIPTGIALTLCLFLAAPARAEVHGGIEIGAKGVKATVLDIVPATEGYDLSVKMAETANTTLSAGIAKTGSFDPKVVEETALAVKRLHDKMKTDFGVPAERIHVVGSSGLFSPILDKPELIDANRKQLSAAVTKACAAKMDFIDAKREAELSIVGIVPRKQRAASVLIDIGSGNTKGGYIAEDGKFATMSVPFGTVTFTERVKKEDGGVANGAKSLSESLLRPVFQKELSGLKELDKRHRVYLSGGIVWAASTLSQPAESGAFTPLTVGHIDGLLAKLASSTEFPAPDLTAIADQKKRKKAASEIAKVKSTFTVDQLHAGLRLLRALAVELKLGEADNQAVFARHGYLGWILAYVAEKGVAKP